MNYTTFLNEESLSVSLIGEKARNLQHLASFGVRTLNGFVVTTSAFRKFIGTHNLYDDIEKLIQCNEPSIAKKLRETILTLPIPDDIVESIQSALNHLSVPNIIVRSSAPQEDSVDASFAGIHESIINVPARIFECVKAIRECWASTFGERAISYRRMKNNFNSLEMAILIQNMIPTTLAGTVWTQFNSNNQMLIEVVPGLGLTLASGLVPADSYLVQMPSKHIVSASVPKKTIKSLCNPSGGTMDYKLDIEFPLLPLSKINEIVDVAVNIEIHKKTPQLIEWGILYDELIIFQSRPITNGSQPIKTHSYKPSNKFLFERKLTGIVASPGFAQGLSRTIYESDDLESINRGEIVVGKHLTPEMVVSLQNAVGIISEAGGITSHAAVIARELNVPAIVSVTNALQQIPTGTEIFVDGEVGFVGILAKSKSDSKLETQSNSPIHNLPNEKMDRQPFLMTLFDALGDFNKLISERRIVLSKTGVLVAGDPLFNEKWKSILKLNDAETIEKSWGESIGNVLVATEAFIKNPSPSTFDDLYDRFVSFYVFNLIAEAYPIEICLRSVIGNYIELSEKSELLAVALDTSYQKELSFPQLITRLSLPLPDTYVSLVRVADNRTTMVEALRTAFDRMVNAFKANHKEFQHLAEAIIVGNYPKRVVNPTLFTTYAIDVYSRVMNHDDFSLLLRCVNLANAFTVFNDVNRFFPLAYAQDLDSALNKIYADHKREGDWSWNRLLLIKQNLR